MYRGMSPLPPDGVAGQHPPHPNLIQATAMHSLITRAREFAVQAHARINHRRKYSLEPYDVHLRDVAQIVASVTDDPEMLAAAWLHDVVEDTPVGFMDIEEAFGAPVAALVRELTDVSRPSDGNRATRRSIDRAHLASASSRGKTVKLADLIDNCRDVCGHDPEFARTYLTEMASLLEVLDDGDPSLYARALIELETHAETLHLPLRVITGRRDPKAPSHEPFLPINRMNELFLGAFTARSIVHPLPSVDDPLAADVAAIMDQHGLPVVGVRRLGMVSGFVSRENPASPQPFAPGQVVGMDAPFSEVILVLSQHNQCFVSLLGAVMGIITRDDLQHPYARMWLFGIVTMLEMEAVTTIERLWPDNAWTSLISANRLAKAELLFAERLRRGQHSSLSSCLQFSDKMQILLEDETVFHAFNFPSKKAARKTCRNLESLRNNLAHAQDIVAFDFAQVATIARRIESLRSD